MQRLFPRVAVLVALLLTAGLLGVSASTASARSPLAGPSGSSGWEVQTDEGTSTITWTSDVRLPISSSRPSIVDADGRSLGPVVVEGDGRSVSVTVAGRAPDPATLDVVLSGARLDAVDPSLPPDGRMRDTLTAPARTLLPDDPSTAGPHAVRSEAYTLPALRIAGLKEPVEMVGHIVEPAASAATGPRPLVVFLHGRHEFCFAPEGKDADTWSWPCVAPAREVPSHLGYDYLQRVLASQGYATVSIRANGINAQDSSLADAGAGARADLVEAHLAHWATMAPEHQVSLDRVVLVGHSRGGEGVNRVSLRTPLTAPHRIVGQVLLAPTDFASQSSPYVPTVTVLPYCDGDVSDLQGQRFVEFGRDLDDDDTALKSAVLLMGANHNYFNTEWTPGTAVAPAADDWFGRKKAHCGTRHAERLTAAEQRSAALALVAGAVRLFAADDQRFAPLFDGSAATVTSMGRAVSHSAAVGGGRQIRRPGSEVTVQLGGTASARVCRAVSSYRDRTALCGRGLESPTPNWPSVQERLPERHALEVEWRRTGDNVVLDLGGELDLTDRRLDLRTTVDPDRKAARFGVLLHDADGKVSALAGLSGGELAALPGGLRQPRHWAQTGSIDPTGHVEVDLSRITAVELVALQTDGRVWIHDVAATAPVIAPVPARRLAVVDLGRIEVAEGDGPGPGTAALPYRVSGSLLSPATLRLVLVPPHHGRVDVVVPAGTASGTVSVPFPRNRTHDDTPVVVQALAVASRAATTGRYVGEVRVLDDESAPKVRLRTGRRTVTEGDAARIVVKMSAAATEHRVYTWRFVRPSGRAARTSDLAARWRDRAGLGGSDLPLHRSHHVGALWIKPGKRRGVIKIPIARDGMAEGPERIALRVHGVGLRTTLELRLRDRVR